MHHGGVRYLLIDEAAEIARVSGATVRYWLAKKKLRSVKPGRRRMILEQDLLEFLQTDSSTALGRLRARRGRRR
jgi:excisionase family DNA binding protein